MKYPKLAALLLAIGLPPVALIGCGGKHDSARDQAVVQDYLQRAENYRRQYRAALIEIRNALQQNPQDRAATQKLAAIFNELGQGKQAARLLEPIADSAGRDEALAIAQAYLLQHKYRSALDYLDAHEQRLKLTGDSAARLLRARAQIGLGNLDAAEALLATLDGAQIDIALDRQRLLRRRGQHEAAETALNQLLQAHPDDVHVLSEAALQAERQGRLSAAEELLTKAVMNLPQPDLLTPQKAEILQRLVSTLTKLGRSNEALVYAKTLADANPAGTLLQDKFKQGLEQFQAGNLDEAEKLLTEVYGDTQSEAAGMLLGMIRYAKKDLSGAANYLGENIDPEVAPEVALTTFAATQLQLAQPDKLLQLFSADERKHLKSPELKMLVGIALLQTGATTEGEQLIQSAQTERPDNPALAAALARHYLATAQPQHAIDTLERATGARADTNLSRLLIAAYALNGNADKALAAARASAESAPASPENWWVLARTALQLRKTDIAESALRKALALQADFVPAQIDLAQLHLSRQQNPQAEAIYRAVLRQRPEHIDAIKGLLLALAQKGTPAAAIETDLLATAAPDSARAVLAEYALRTQQFDEAERQLAALAPGDTAPYPQQLRLQMILVRGAQALQNRELDKARGIVAKGLELAPNSPQLLVFLAQLDLQANNLASAKKIAAQLAQTQPQLPPVLELRGDIAAQEGDAAAAQHYRAAWQKLPGEGVAFKLYQSLGKTPDAQGPFLDEWLRKLPNSTNAHFLRGLQKQERGDQKGAMADYEQALARNPADARALNNLAWLYAEHGDPRALATAERAYALQPQNPAVLDTYGWILVQAGQVKRGIEQLQAAQKLAPDAQEIREHLEQAGKRL